MERSDPTGLARDQSIDNEESDEAPSQEISVNVLTADDDRSHVEEKIAHSSIDIGDQLIATAEGDCPATVLELGTTTPIHHVDIPGTGAWWLPHALTRRWISAIFSILPVLFYSVLAFAAHVLVEVRQMRYIRSIREYDSETINRLIVVDLPIPFSTQLEVVENAPKEKILVPVRSRCGSEVTSSQTFIVSETSATEPTESDSEDETTEIDVNSPVPPTPVINNPVPAPTEVTVRPITPGPPIPPEPTRQGAIDDNAAMIATAIDLTVEDPSQQPKIRQDNATEEIPAGLTSTDEQ